MKKINLPIAALFLGALFSANTCSENSTGNAANAAAARGKWELASIGGQAINLPAGAQRPFLNIDSLGRNVSGFAGCNQLFGSVALRGDSLSFPGLASTKMYCREAAQLEDGFLQALNATRTFAINGNELVLKAGKDLAVLRRTE